MLRSKSYIVFAIFLIIQISCKKEYDHTTKRGLYLLSIQEVYVNQNANDTTIRTEEYLIDFRSSNNMYITIVDDTVGFDDEVNFQYQEINELFGSKPGMTFPANPIFCQNASYLTLKINEDQSEIWEGSSNSLFSSSKTYYTGSLKKK